METVTISKGGLASLISVCSALWNVMPLSFAFLLFTFYFCIFTFASPLTVLAQDDPDQAPPPVKVVAREERVQLDAVQDLKVRTKLALDLMNLRLTVAEKLNSAQDLDGFYRELGLFRGLLDYTLGFLATHSRNDKKTLDNYKRVEISLRGFIPRLETIYREIPVQYEEYVRELLKYLRQARTKAVEPLFSDTVIPVQKQE